jgi:hypothetical protein
MLKPAKDRRQVTYDDKPIKITAEFSTQTPNEDHGKTSFRI